MFKAIEEVNEFRNSKSRQETLDEAVDVIQVMLGLIEKMTYPEERKKLFERHFLKIKQYESDMGPKRARVQIIGKIKIEFMEDV